MPQTADWHARFAEEMARAEAALARGLDGQARVCARRAAGVVLREVLARRSGSQPAASAYDLIRACSADPGIPASVRQVLALLLERVSPNYEGPAAGEVLKAAASLPALLGLE